MKCSTISRSRLAPLVLLTLLTATASAQRIYAWGDNGVGQLNIPAAAQTSPRQVQTGYYFSLTLDANGGVTGCGDNSYGELNIPVAAQSGVSKIGAGVLHGLAIKGGGVIAWGSNERGETNVPSAAGSGVTAVSGGEYSSLAVKNGGVIGWGSNDYGLLNIPAGAQNGVTAIASGSYHCLALKNGGVMGWGMDVAGDLNIPASAQSDVVGISCGYLHSLALKSDGRVVAWGWNSSGQCDVPVAAQSNVIAIAAGYDFSVALKDDGTIVMWGDNDYGWLNQPSDASPAISVSASSYHTLSLKAPAWVTLDQTSVASGFAIQGTVNLPAPAGPGGVVVDVASDNAHVGVPSQVLVAAGQTTAPFTISASAFVGSDEVAVLRASIDGSPSVAKRLNVTAIPVALLLSRSSVVGGSTRNVEVTVTLADPVFEDITLQLASSNSALATVARSVTIPAGEAQASVPISHFLVSSGLGEPVTITASSEGHPVANVDLEVQPFTALVTLESTTVTAGDPTTVFVTLNAPPRAALTITPATSDPTLTMPATATVKAGARTAYFPVGTTPTDVGGTHVVTVFVQGNPYGANLKVLANAKIQGITLAATLTGATHATGTVRLTKPAGASGSVVQLSAGSELTVPPSVTVPEGQLTATFNVTVADVASASTSSVTATGLVNQVTRPVAIQPLTPISLVAPATGSSGETFQATVTLKKAPDVDTTIDLTASNLMAAVPASVTVLAGHTSATFTVQLGTTTRVRGVTLKASKGGKTVSRHLVVNP